MLIYVEKVQPGFNFDEITSSVLADAGADNSIAVIKIIFFMVILSRYPLAIFRTHGYALTLRDRRR